MRSATSRCKAAARPTLLASPAKPAATACCRSRGDAPHPSDNAKAAAQIDRAGAIFVGAFTPEAAGDYTAGPSHVLPTAGAAGFSSPLGVWDFVKYTSVLELSEDALMRQASAITTLARAEGLEAHARAVEIRSDEAQS